MSTRGIEALLRVLVDNTSGLNALAELLGATEATQKSFKKLDDTSLNNVEKGVKSVDKALDKTEDKTKEVRKGFLEAFGDPGSDAFRDNVAKATSVFGDIDTSISTLAGAGAELGIISAETEKQLIKVREAFGAVEAGARLAADGMALASKLSVALNVSMTTLSVAGGVAAAAMFAAKTALDIFSDTSKATFEELSAELEAVNRLRLEEANLIQTETLASLDAKIKAEQENLDFVNQQREELFLGNQQLEKLLGPSLKELNNRRQESIDTLEILTDATVRQAIAQREFLDSFGDRVDEEIEAQKLAGASSEELTAKLATMQTAFDAGEKALADMTAEIGQKALADMVAEVGIVDPESMGVSEGFTNILDGLIESQAELEADIADTKALLESAEAREREKAIIEEATAAREEFSDATAALVEFDQEQLQARTRLFQDAAREAERSGLLVALAAEEQRANALIEAERFQDKIEGVEQKGRDKRLDIIEKSRDKFNDLNEDFRETQRESAEEFSEEQQKAAEDHNRKLLEINNDLSQDLLQLTLDNDVVGFIQRQQQGEEALKEEKDSFALRNKEATEAFADERREAKRNFDQRLRDLRAAHANELRANQAATSQRLQQLRNSANQELTENERLLKEVQNRKSQLQRLFASEDLAIEAQRQQARLDIQRQGFLAEQRATAGRVASGAISRVQDVIQRLPIFDDGAIITRPTIGILAANSQPEMVIPLDNNRTMERFGRGTPNITVNVAGIGNIASQDDLTALKQAFIDGWRDAMEATS